MSTRPFQQLQLDGRTQLRLSELRKEMGLPSKAAVVRALVAEHAKSLNAPPASFTSAFGDSRPIILAGPSGAGKTTTAKRLLAQAGPPILVLDPSNEYAEYSEVAYAQVAGIKWEANALTIRVPLSADVGISVVEASLVFRQLALAMSQNLLKGWTFVIEEAHRFSSDPTLKALLLEARKGTRKLLVLTAEPDPFSRLAPVFGPLPH